MQLQMRSCNWLVGYHLVLYTTLILDPAVSLSTICGGCHHNNKIPLPFLQYFVTLNSNKKNEQTHVYAGISFSCRGTNISLCSVTGPILVLCSIHHLWFVKICCCFRSALQVRRLAQLLPE